MRRAALLWMAAALFAGSFYAGRSLAYWGSFDPVLLKNEATVNVIDTQLPNIECAMRARYIIEAPLIAALSAGCADIGDNTLIAAITPGPMWIWLLSNLVTPNQLIGHELSHIFRGEFHPPFLSFIERVPSQGVPSGVVRGDK